MLNVNTQMKTLVEWFHHRKGEAAAAVLVLELESEHELELESGHACTTCTKYPILQGSY